MNYLDKKVNTPFKKCDVILYAITAIIIATCFLLISILSSDQTKLGFRVYQNDSEIIKFSFSSNDYTFYNNAESFVDVSRSGNVYTFKIFCGDNLTEYNLLEVNTSNKTAKITDSNCPSKDCQSLDLNSGIVCIPHGLRIIPTTNNGHIVTG